jgi:hypothetical protein
MCFMSVYIDRQRAKMFHISSEIREQSDKKNEIPTIKKVDRGGRPIGGG